MFQQVEKDLASDGTAVSVQLKDYRQIIYCAGGRQLSFRADISYLPPKPGFVRCLQVHYPLRPVWGAPHQGEPIHAEENDRIATHIEDGLRALGFEARFVPVM